MEQDKITLFKYLTKRKYQSLKKDKTDYTKSYILYLLSNGNALSPSDITKEINIKPQALANALKAMEEDGLITRKINPDNKRMTNIYITSKGLEVGKAYCDKELAKIEDLLNYLGEQDTKELLRIMGKIDIYLESRGEE